MSQLSGTNAIIGSPDAAVTDIIAPEISTSETASFQLTVSDGANSVIENIDIEVTNIFQSPRSQFAFENIQISQTVPENSEIIRTETSDDSLSLASFMLTPSDTQNENMSQISTIARSFESNSTNITSAIENIEVPSTTRSISIENSGFNQGIIYAASEEDNIVAGAQVNSAFPQFNDNVGNYPIDAPCDITGINNGSSRTPVFGADGPANINLVGQRNGGLEILASDFSDPPSGSTVFQLTGSTTLQSIGTNENYCLIDFIDKLALPTDIANNAPFGGVVTAIDMDNQTIDLFVDTISVPASETRDFIVGTSQNPQYERVLSFPILPTDQPDLEILGTELVNISRGQHGYLFLLSDGNHIGEHRAVLIIIIEAADNATTGSNALDFSRTILSWERGVPENAILGIEGNFFNNPTIIINSSTSPEAIVFENDATQSTEFFGPSFFEIGLDVDMIFPATFNIGQSSGIVTFSSSENLLALRIE